MSRRWANLLLVPLLLGAVWVVYVDGPRAWEYVRLQRARDEEHRRLVRLFEEAQGYPPYVRSSDSSIQAVREIGASSQDDATEMLVTLATKEPLATLTGVQIQAIRDLQSRKDPKIPGVLSALVTTDTLIGARLAAARALQTLPCDQECTTRLLSYLNDIDRGKRNIEDQDTPEAPRDLRALTVTIMGAEQDQVYRQVRSDLLRNPKITNAVLENAYGLGGAEASAFAIHFVVQTNDTLACPMLKQSAMSLESSFRGSLRASQNELRQALILLHCDK